MLLWLGLPVFPSPFWYILFHFLLFFQQQKIKERLRRSSRKETAEPPTWGFSSLPPAKVVGLGCCEALPLPTISLARTTLTVWKAPLRWLPRFLGRIIYFFGQQGTAFCGLGRAGAVAGSASCSVTSKVTSRERQLIRRTPISRWAFSWRGNFDGASVGQGHLWLEGKRTGHVAAKQKWVNSLWHIAKQASKS